MTHDFDDEALRTAVHDAYGAIVPGTGLEDFRRRVRAGAVRRRAARRAGVLGGAVALIGVAWAAVALAGGVTTRATPTAATPAAPPCPAAPFGPRPGSALRTGTGSSLVPGEPRIATACVFTTTTRADGSSETALSLREPLTGDHFVSVLREVRSAIKPGLPRCPASPSSVTVVLVFAYGSGPDVTVSAGVQGCPMIANGALSGVYQPVPDLDQLAALVSR